MLSGQATAGGHVMRQHPSPTVQKRTGNSDLRFSVSVPTQLQSLPLGFNPSNQTVIQLLLFNVY